MFFQEHSFHKLLGVDDKPGAKQAHATTKCIFAGLNLNHSNNQRQIHFIKRVCVECMHRSTYSFVGLHLAA